jgi:copper homeostasis protein
MQNGYVLEVCVESVDRAIAAERGGAHRIELCSDLSSGGITPSAGLMQVARQSLRIPIHILVRPRAGDFVYSDREFEVMKRDIDTARRLGMDGVVLGLLDGSSQVDVQRTAQLVKAAHPLPVTFHRAFDLCRDMRSALEAVIQTGSARVLTSGGKTRAMEGLGPLSRLVGEAGTRIVVMPGGGIAAEDVTRVLQQTSAHEIHTSLRVPNVASDKEKMDGATRESEFEARVRKVRELLESLSRGASPST